MNARRVRKLQPDIPMVSMADVAFLLIVFFLLTTTFMKEAGLTLKLPGATPAESLPKRDIAISVARDLTISLDGQHLRLSQLGSALQKELRGSRIRSVSIRGDGDVPHKIMIAVYDIVRQQGVINASLAIEPVSTLNLEALESPRPR